MDDKQTWLIGKFTPCTWINRYEYGICVSLYCRKHKKGVGRM